MSAAIDDLLEACRARPQSTALQAALLDATQGVADPAVIDFLASLDAAGHDEAHRRRVADFLSEAGREAAAVRWAPNAPESFATPQTATVVQLFADGVATVAPMILRQSEIRFEDVGGLESVKKQIRRKIIAPFEKPSLFRAFRKRSGGGVLMYGPPGCGKTMLARATAGEVRAAFFSVAITDVLDKYIGESERKLAAIFAQARSHTPSVLFFDEIEALTSRSRANGDVGASLVSTFLNEMDGFAGRDESLLILAATNTPWAVDPAFRRPGRFDRTLFVPPPDATSRTAILRGLLSGRPVAPGLDVTPIAAKTSSFSGADLSELVETAAELAIEDSLEGAITPISKRHLEAALKEVRPSTLEWLGIARNYAKYANESGLYDEVRAFLEKNGR
jgi:SpoVK/Ycf46/Vps4 family AAA+-type ATPase